jgi:hypothetical protein
MIRAFAPRNPRGYSWVLLTIAVLFAWAGTAEAQARKPRGKAAAGSSRKAGDDGARKEMDDDGAARKDDGAARKDDGAAGKDDGAARKKADADAAKPAEGADAQPKDGTVEVFKDPRAEAILKTKFPGRGRVPNPNNKKSVLRMAANAENVDRATIDRFIDGAIYMLTNPANAEAISAGQGGAKALDIRKGTEDLLEVLHKGQANHNAPFLTEYNRALVSKLNPQVLENNLFARIEAMIVLGQTGSPDVVPVCIKQLGDSKQTIWVKIWAARGITTATAGGTRDLPQSQALQASKALEDWLTKSDDLPWFAQMRGLEALGALRHARMPQNRDEPEFADVAMRFLADSDARPEVRAMAAWALGMMQIDNALSKFNFTLVGYNIGEVAADLGEKVNAVFDENQNQSRYYTGFLLYQIHPALDGAPNVRNGGLLKGQGAHPAFNQARPFLQQLDDLVKPVYKVSVELLNAPRGRYPEMRKELAARVAALRTFLRKNPPQDVRLVPGGKPFPGNAVAAVPAEK